TSGNDTLYGDALDDILYGGGGTDEIHGGSGDDIIQGNDGVDTIYGEAGQDDIAGGTGRTTSNSAASAVDGRKDSNDLIYGADDYDVIAGDNADIQRTATWSLNTFNGGKQRVVSLLDIGTVSAAAGAGTSGNDALYGDAQDDALYGGGGNDLVRGGSGDDTIQGNDGADNIFGDAGQDDIAGGTGRTVSNNAATAVNGRLDGADVIYGGDGYGGITSGDFDVIAGDNADVQRLLDGGGAWTSYTFLASSRIRTVTLYDVATVTAAAGAGTSGNDSIFGEASSDVVYGQDGNDYIRGYHIIGTAGFSNDDDDFLFGNAGNDTIYGDGGQDDIVGGTARTISDNDYRTTADNLSALNGRLDGDDTIYGDDGVGTGMDPHDFDVIVGDNAVVDRPLDPSGLWIRVQWDQWNRDASDFDLAVQRLVALLDKPVMDVATPTGVSGNDTLSGGISDDVLYGQTGDDTLYGNDGNDIIYADLGNDDIFGGLGDDVMYGQGGIDHIFGEGGKDVVHGGASDLFPSCTSGDRADPYNDSREFEADDTRDTPETRGKNEGSKGQTPIKRKNPVCLQLVEISISTADPDILAGGVTIFTAIATYDDGSTADISGQVIWRSSSTATATVNANGVATGVGAGTATITAALRGINSNSVTLEVA
ncbi:MAG: Ig-like domain-containing protein, partial [Chloroflexi bacterium]|nr:Ig-like domain-containing protein [Chloroflexota bacterium]